jgi:hypothetical protein
MTGDPIPDPAADPAGFLARLADRLTGAGLGESLAVERRRRVADRLAGRPGQVESVEVRALDQVLTLALDGGRLQGRAAREVRGVVISRRTLPVGEWLDLLSDLLGGHADHRTGDRAAAREALVELGLVDRAADVAVDPADVDAGLAALPGRVSAALPADLVPVVAEICGLLREALPRVPPGGEQAEVLRRTAVGYLPATLRGYLALPAQWAATRPVDGDRTALDLLREQLGLLRDGVASMHDAAVASDADRLLANGYFLRDRFTRSSLDG